MTKCFWQNLSFASSFETQESPILHTHVIIFFLINEAKNSDSRMLMALIAAE